MSSCVGDLLVRNNIVSTNANGDLHITPSEGHRVIVDGRLTTQGDLIVDGSIVGGDTSTDLVLQPASGKKVVIQGDFNVTGTITATAGLSSGGGGSGGSGSGLITLSQASLVPMNDVTGTILNAPAGYSMVQYEWNDSSPPYGGYIQLGLPITSASAIVFVANYTGYPMVPRTHGFTGQSSENPELDPIWIYSGYSMTLRCFSSRGTTGWRMPDPVPL